MKLLIENWRKHLNEITSVPPEHMQAFKETIASSKFWTLPHTEDEIDMGPADELTTPAVESLANSLNDTADALGTEIYFLFTTVNEEEYALAPDSPYPGYPDNWLMQGAYQGPQKGKHVVWFQFRPLSEDFEMDKFNPEALVKVLSQTLNHELVHYYQLKKQAASKGISDEEAWAELEKDPKQLPQDSEEQTYLGLHNEIDAYAHEAAEQLLDQHSPEEALDIIRKLSADNLEKYPEISSVVKRYVEVFKDDPKTLAKFRKKLVQQVENQSGIQEIFNNWRKFLRETERPGPGRTKSRYERMAEPIAFDGFAKATYDATGESGEFLEEDIEGKVKIYRALPATTTEVRTNDYVTMSRRFAGEHAVTSALYNEEDFYVVYAFVNGEDVKEADNPGEYRYTGEPFEAKPTQIANHQTGDLRSARR